jgi:putative hydrolase of HD superfamily
MEKLITHEQRLRSQMAFLNELEKLKTVYRRNRTVDRSRQENTAEHSWHVAMMAIVLLEHADTRDMDLWKIVKMLLIHDIVEIVAGDTWLYDSTSPLQQNEEEEKAAQKLFSLLPSDQADEFLKLWREFNERSSPEAAFAAGIDALQPLANHLASGEQGDVVSTPSVQQVVERKRHIENSSRVLWQAAQELIQESVKKGLYER